MNEIRMNTTALHVEVGINVMENCSVLLLLLLIKVNIPMKEKYSKIAFWKLILKSMLKSPITSRRKI